MDETIMNAEDRHLGNSGLDRAGFKDAEHDLCLHELSERIKKLETNCGPKWMKLMAFGSFLLSVVAIVVALMR